MSTRKRPDLRDLCAQTHDEDGVDPRYARDQEERAASRKDLQLCKQAQRALASALLGCADPVLSECEVLSVEPNPTAGRLRVVVASACAAGDVLARLAAAKGMLRAELARVITRKKVPELVFAVGVREVPDEH